jgi:hypothetical protein
MLAESLPNAPALLPVRLRSLENALLPFAGAPTKWVRRIRNFGTMLEPRYIVGAEPLDQ